MKFGNLRYDTSIQGHARLRGLQYPYLQLGVGGPSTLDGHLDQLPHALLVDRLEGVPLEHSVLEVVGDELAGIVPVLPLIFVALFSIKMEEDEG